jgi:predicted nucleic acid-binding protein
MIVALDTTFFVLHYFSKDNNLLSKTRKVLFFCRKLGNKGILPTIVIGEFYALTRKKAGRDVAGKYFNELLKSGLKIRDMTAEIARQAGILRCKYRERIPWGDCIIAATGILSKSEMVITEDPYFKQIKEIKAQTLAEVKV